MRWFAYVDTDKKWHLNSLLDNKEIKSIYRTLPRNYEAYASIQNYDAKANIQSCPLYIDVDSSSLYDAWETTKDTWCKLKSDFEISPHIYFSGSKGFHIIMPLLIKHEKCHLVAREIAEEYCIDMDTAVYTSRRMWRCNGSINAKTNNYKIKIPSLDWSLDDILDFSKQGSEERFVDYNFVYYKSNLFDELVKESADLIKPIINKKYAVVPFEDIDPCVMKLWSLNDIKVGQRNNTLHLLARSCLKFGDTEEQAMNRFLFHTFWRSYDKSSLWAVVKSVYRGNIGKWTCWGKGIDAKILNEHCVGNTCAWHKDFAWSTPNLNSNQSHETITKCTKIS